jgi:hypothetical protein
VGPAVFGQAEPNGRGVVGVSAAHTAIEGNTKSGVAVFGLADASGGRGVVGATVDKTAVEGNAKSGIGVYATSESNEAVHAETKSAGNAAIAAFNLSPTTGAAIYAKKAGTQGEAGFFIGKVVVDGDFEVRKDIKLADGTSVAQIQARLKKVEEDVQSIIRQLKYLRMPDGRYVWGVCASLEQRVQKLEDDIL